jgi:hypothetical protein
MAVAMTTTTKCPVFREQTLPFPFAVLLEVLTGIEDLRCPVAKLVRKSLSAEIRP